MGLGQWVARVCAGGVLLVALFSFGVSTAHAGDTGSPSTFLYSLSNGDANHSGVYLDGNSQGGTSGGWMPSWAPDGDQFVFVDGRGGISVSSISNHFVYRLTTDTGDYAPDWSADGSTIVFMRYGHPGNSDIYAMSAVDGSRLSRLSSDPGNDSYPKLSPDGKWLAYASDANQAWHLYLAKADGSNPHVIDDGTGGSYSGTLAWSPNSRTLAYNHDEYMYLIDIATSHTTRIGDHFASLPAFAPDGSRISTVNAASNQSEYHIWTVPDSGDGGGGFAPASYTVNLSSAMMWVPPKHPGAAPSHADAPGAPQPNPGPQPTPVTTNPAHPPVPGLPPISPNTTRPHTTTTTTLPTTGAVVSTITSLATLDGTTTTITAGASNEGAMTIRSEPKHKSSPLGVLAVGGLVGIPGLGLAASWIRLRRR